METPGFRLGHQYSGMQIAEMVMFLLADDDDYDDDDDDDDNDLDESGSQCEEV